MRTFVFCVLLLGVVTVVAAEVRFDVYESDGVTPFDGRNIRVGTELKIIVSADSNDLWSGGFFLNAENRNLGCLAGSGYDPNTGDWGGCHYLGAGSEAYVSVWEDSLIEGFDLFTSLEDDAEPGPWFVVDYIALQPGEPNIGFYDYAVSWDDANAFVFVSQVPLADFNTDGIVNLLDYSLLASCWLTNSSSCLEADMDGDTVVDANDLFLFADSWLWRADSNPNPNEPQPDPNLIYSVVDANSLGEITMAIGESVTFYVAMNSLDPNHGIWAFEVEVDISDPNLGSIDNTAYDPNNPPGGGTARILAGPSRIEGFDYWGPGNLQPEGIYLFGASLSGGFDDGHLASFVYTCQAAGDVVLNLVNHNSMGTSGQNRNPILNNIVIHQYDPFEGESMMLSSMSMDTTLVQESTVPEASPEEMVQFLEGIWDQNPEIQDCIDEKEWKEFIKSVEQSY